jgi:hypothetical protein
MKTWLKIFLAIIALMIIGAFCIYHFVINKPHPDYEKEAAKYSLTATELFKEFTTDRKASETKYNGQVIEISGKFKSIEKNDTLSVVVFSFRQGMFGDEGIRCTMLPKFTEKVTALSNDSEIKIKGYCTGYNDTDVILVKCSINE